MVQPLADRTFQLRFTSNQKVEEPPPPIPKSGAPRPAFTPNQEVWIVNHQSLLNGTKAYIVELIKETGLWQVEVDIEGDLFDIPAQNISPRPPRAEQLTDPAQNISPPQPSARILQRSYES